MAHVQTVIETQSFGEKIIAPFRQIGAFFVRLSEANVRVRELEHLNAMSDADGHQVSVNDRTGPKFRMLQGRRTSATRIGDFGSMQSTFATTGANDP